MADLKKYITEPGLIFEGFFRQASSYSVFKNKSEFKVKVLTNPIPYTGPDPDIETGDPSSDQRSQKYWFKGRILDPNMTHEKFLPDPCDNTIAADPEYTQALVSLHATVFAETKPDCGIGDIILAFIGPGDNNKIYNLQHMKWIKTETKNSGPLVIGQECFKLSEYDWDQSIFFDESVSVPIAANQTSRFDKNMEIYKIIADALLDNVLFHIRDHESGNDPNIRNFGEAGVGTTSSPTLTELTFDQVRAVHRGGTINGVSYKNSQGKNPFALGYYQIIPNTLDYIVGVLPELKDMPFNEENQHIAATVLIIDKRPKMGEYLLGEINEVEIAGQHWAYEWAYAPSHFQISKGANGAFPKVNINPGMSYYSGAAGNRSGTTTTEIIKTLEEGRTQLQKSLSQIENLSNFETDEMVAALGF